MPIRKRTIDLAVDYAETHFFRRYLFPIAPGKKFPPTLKDNLDSNCSNDPDQLRAWEEKWPGCNWGVAHRKSGLMVIDVDCDKTKGKVGQQTFTNLELEYGDFPKTEKTITPSGGFHLIYEGWEVPGDGPLSHPAHIMALGENGLGKHIDSPNYTLIPGCTFDDGTSYVGDGAEAARCPAFVYDVIRSSKTRSRITDAGEVVIDLDQQRNIDTAIDYLKTDAEPSIQGSGGDWALLKAAYYLKDLGISQQLGAELLNEYFNPRCEPPWEMEDFEKKMAGAFNYANLSKVGGKTAEADFADDPPPPITPQGNKKKIAAQKKERAEAKARQPDSPEKAKTKADVLNQFVWVTSMKRFVSIINPAKRERRVWDREMFDSVANELWCPKRGSAADLLLRTPNSGLVKYYGVDFKPGQPQTLNGGVEFNMYRAPDLTPTEGDLTVWNEHIEYLFPDETYRNHLLNWMAWLVQNLAQKPKHALIIQGEVNGTGKSFIGRVLARILHEANVSIVPQNGLSGRFNAWALQCKLIVIEELRASDKRAVKEALHDIITEDRISIEKKGVDTFMVDTCFGVLSFTNDDAALDLDNTDRRYLVVRTDATPRDPKYYARLFALLEDPAAMSAIMYLLVNRDLQGYSGQQPAPMTEAKAGMKRASMSDLEHHLDDARGTWPLTGRVVSIEDVIMMLPKRLETKGFRLHTTIKKFLLNDLRGVDLGQCVTPTGKRPRLYAINGAGAILEGQPRPVAGKVYEEDKAKAGKNQPLDDLDAGEEFGEAE